MKKGELTKELENKELIVIGHNDLSSLPFKESSFNALDFNIFWTIVYFAMGKGTQEVEIGFNTLSSLCINDNSSVGIRNAILRCYDKVFHLTDNYVTEEGEIVSEHLFEKFQINGMNAPDRKPSIVLKFSERFSYLVNTNIKTGQFSYWDLNVIVSKLRSVHAKSMYLHLRKWRSTGLAIYSEKEFRRAMYVSDEIPERNLRVKINKVVEELSPFFPGLKIQDNKPGYGQKATKYKVTFNKMPELDTSEIRKAMETPKDLEESFSGKDTETKKPIAGIRKKKTSWICKECRAPFYEITKEDGTVFYGHKDGGSEDCLCNLAFSNIDDVKACSLRPEIPIDIFTEEYREWICKYATVKEVCEQGYAVVHELRDRGFEIDAMHLEDRLLSSDIKDDNDLKDAFIEELGSLIVTIQEKEKKFGVSAIDVDDVTLLMKDFM